MAAIFTLFGSAQFPGTLSKYANGNAVGNNGHTIYFLFCDYSNK